MGKGKNKKGNNQKKDIRTNVLENVSSATYTPEVFYDSFPDRTEEDFLYLSATPLRNGLRMYEHEHQDAKINSMRKVMLDEEFLDWLKENKKENCEKSRIEYITSLSDEEVERLWNKNIFSSNIEMGYLVNILMDLENGVRNEDEICISDELVLNEIRKILAKEKNISPKDIAISNTLYKPDYFIENLEEEYTNYLFSDDLLKTNTILLKSSPKMKSKSDEKINVAIRIMPIAIKTYKPWRYSRKEILKAVDSKQLNPEFREHISDKIAKVIKNGIGLSNQKIFDIQVFSQIIDIEDIADYVIQLHKDISKMTQVHNSKYIR